MKRALEPPAPADREILAVEPGNHPQALGPREQLSSKEAARQGPKFHGKNDFQVELRRRVHEHFRTTGRRQRDCPRMYVKTAIVFSWLVTSYLLLVFGATSGWQVIPVAISLALAMAAVGFNVQHDARHQAYSDRPWINQWMALSLDLLGASSYVWHWKHNVYHHTYVNITGHDTDIELGPLARIAPHQRHRRWHRYQHWYIWLLYALFTFKWQWFDDFQQVLNGRIDTQRMPRPRGWDLLAFLGGKASSFSLALALPLLLHPLGSVLLVYGLVLCILGLVLSVVFQLAHCVEDAAFPLPEGQPGRMANAWAVHQVETSVNFARRSRLAAWYLGGLNFQIEHHLLPRICHVNYPALAPLVEATCREFGVRYAVHESFRAGLAAHYRWLRRMGRPDPDSHRVSNR